MIDDDARSQNGGSAIACWKLLIFHILHLKTAKLRLEGTASLILIQEAALYGPTALHPGLKSTKRSIF